MTVMTDRITIDDIRERLGGNEVDALMAELARSDDEYAALDARYGPGGTFDAQRKAHRSAIEVQIRADAKERGEKLTEAAAEALAASDLAVIALLANAEAERTRYAVLSSQREVIRERLRWLRALAYAAGGEARLV